MIVACSAARRPTSRRMRMTDGLPAFDWGQEAAEVDVGGDEDLSAGSGLLEDCFVGYRLHAEVALVDGVVPGCLERVGQERGKVVVDEEPHAVSRSGNSRSRTASAAYGRDSWISSAVSPGCSARMSSVPMPSASIASTVATGKRSPRMQGRPPMTAGSVVMRS
jgi:hypothetical protein